MTFKFKVGDKVVLNTDHYPDDTTNGIYSLKNWKDRVFVVERTEIAHEAVKWSKGITVNLEGIMYAVCESMLSFAKEEFSLANTKIDVQKYAEENNISLEQAHKEIQTWLLGQGVVWCTGSKDVINTAADGLFIDSSLNLSYGWRFDECWVEDGSKEIFLTRSMSLSAAYAEEEYITIEGKKYKKRDVEQALLILEKALAGKEIE